MKSQIVLPGRPSKKPVPDAIASLQGYIETVSQEKRDALADLLLTFKVREFTDLTDVVMLLTSHIVRGDIPTDIAVILRGYLEVVYTNIATKGRSEQQETAGNALQQLIEASKRPKVLTQPVYSMDEEETLVTIDISPRVNRS